MSMFDRRYRGFRIVNFAAVAVLLALMLGVYLAKTRASADSAAIATAERQILEEKSQIRVLQAQVAGLETPERIEKLSSEYLGMVPIDAKHETRPENLAQIAGVAPPASSAATPQVAP